jgi:hypothetical protein
MFIELTACWFTANITWVKWGARVDYIAPGEDNVTSILYAPEIHAVLVYRVGAKDCDIIPWSAVSHAKCADPIELFTRPKGKK